MCKRPIYFDTFIHEICSRNISLRKNPSIIRILKSRLNYYNQRIDDINSKSWKIPDAVFPKHPKIEDFLKLNQQSIKYYGFSNKFDANCFVKDNKDSLEAYSLSYTSEGKGANACVKLTKSEDYQKAQNEQKIIFETKVNWINKIILEN